MSDLVAKNGWKTVELSEIVNIKYGKTLPTSQFTEKGFPVFGANGIIGSYSEYLYEEEQVLISCRGAYSGAINFSPLQSFITNNSLVLEILSDQTLTKKYLFYALHTVDKSQLVTGSAQPQVTINNAKILKIPVAPLDEQRRIVAEIEKQFTRLDAGVAALQRVQLKLKRYRASVLKSACEGRLVPTESELAKVEAASRRLSSETTKSRDGSSTYEPAKVLLQRILTERREKWNGRGKYKEPAAPDIANLPELPEGWVWASIDQITAHSLIGLDRGRAQQSSDPSSGFPYIKMNNVTMDGRVLLDSFVYVSASKEETERFAIQDGDILFNTRNSTELVGKTGIVFGARFNTIYNNNLMRIRLLSDAIPAFLNYQMCSTEFRYRMELVKKATTNVAAVYAKDLFPLAIALPPHAEQERIVAEIERRLSMVDELEATVTANLQRATRLRQAILLKAFSGK